MTSTRREPSRLPIRGAIGAGVTAAGLAMLLSLRPPEAADAQLAFLVSDPPTGARGSTSQTGLALVDASPSADPGVSASASPSASPAASATPAATATVPITLVGDPVSFRFGTVQVQVTVENGAIIDVVALQLPDEDRHSLRISEEVEPILAEETLSTQSAGIDTVSGATYTSLAYAQSLQSALDQLAA